MTDRIFKTSHNGLAFVGDFEGLYRDEPDPWGQSGADDRMCDYYHYSRNTLMDVLESRFPGPASGLEIGCGLGYLTRRLNARIGWTVTGMDISTTAITHARMNGPERYEVGDVTSSTFVVGRRYDFVILAQCWWYLLHALHQSIGNAMESVKRGGVLVISQAFLRKQQYGNDIADGIDGAMQVLSGFPRLTLIEMRYDDSTRRLHHDGILAYRVSA